MTILCFCLEKGYGVTQDKAKGLKTYEAAAKKGDKHAMYNAGLLYSGINPGKAFFYFEQAANLSHLRASNELESCYYDGFGVTRDLYEARDIFRISSTFREASNSALNFGGMLMLGEGGDAELVDGFARICEAASLRNESAVQLVEEIIKLVKEKTGIFGVRVEGRKMNEDKVKE